MKWTIEEIENLKSWVKENLSSKEIAKKLGRSLSSVNNQRSSINAEITLIEKPKGESFEKSETDANTVITCQSHTIRTLKDALEAGKVDLKVWEVERHVINKWDCVASIKNQLNATELWQVKVWLRRKVSKSIEEGVKAFLAQIPSYKYTLPEIKQHSDPYLMEMSIWDHHFGKLAWAKETGENYDLAIAEKIYSNAAHELIEKSRGFNIAKIILPIGQDFFHIDGPLNTTTAGTMMDVDGRLSKIFATGQRALINLVDLLMGIAPVHILWVPGNHDWYTSWYLIKVLEAWYRSTKRVTIDASEMPRKCIEYGVNLLGYTHGNEEKHSSLPAIMAGAWPLQWSRTRHREWKIGHFHKVKETHYNAAETIDGVLVRVLPSLSGTDSWHFRKGFVGGMRAAQAYLYSEKHGYAGHINANAKV